MTAQSFTVFARWNDNSERQGKPCYFPTFKDEVARSLPERIELVRNHFGAGSFIPVAWTTDLVGLGDFEQWEARAVAAGRVIEFRDGKYIPLGVAEEAPKAASVKDQLIYDAIVDAYLASKAQISPPPKPATERVRPPLTWATPKPVDRWEGFTTNYNTEPQFEGDAHPLQRMTDPSDPLHGSAALLQAD